MFMFLTGLKFKQVLFTVRFLADVMEWMMKELYVIGNGFDMHHGINTSYSDFRKYLLEENYKLYQTIEKFLFFEMKDEDSTVWNEFEYNLRNLDEDQIRNECDFFLKGYGDEDWRDCYHYDYQHCIDQIKGGLTSDLLKEFTKWIKLKNKLLNDVAKDIYLKKEAMFLTFNYTMMLENVYGVDSNMVLHIHNSVDDECELILGHNYSGEERIKDFSKPPTIRFVSEIDELLARRGLEKDDVRYREGEGLIQEYYAENYKNSYIIIQKHNAFFRAISDVDTIYVLGHSVSNVDMDYFDEILSKVSETSNWYFTYYSEQDLCNIENFISSRKINHYILLRLSDDLFKGKNRK